MSISQLYPAEGPTLNLNFAGSRTLDPRITFTRTQTTSNGSTYMGRDGLVKYAGPNEPRFDHRYVNGEIESLGLLVEEQRTNLFTTSEVFVSGWGGPGTPNTDTILNPYGVLGTVYYITGNERYRTFNATGYSTLAFSFFTKKRFGGLERDYTYIEIFQVAIGGGSLGTYYFRFNADNLDTTYFKDVKREEYPNGWYRFSCRLIARPDYNGGVFSTSTRVDIEGSVSDNYVWGLQVEAGAFPTSYIPTEGSTVTRNPDNASITGSNFTEWYNPSEGTLFVKAESFAAPTELTAVASLNVPSSYASNRIDIRYQQGGASYCFFNGEAALTRPSGFSLSNPKFIAGYKQNTQKFSTNGSLASASASFTPSPNITHLQIGTFDNFSYELNGCISQLSYYPFLLTDNQLITLTR